jgi:uncharacterized protein YxeA
MKKVILVMICILVSAVSVQTMAANKNKKSNIYISKKYKGHKCPKARNVINAKYY